MTKKTDVITRLVRVIYRRTWITRMKRVMTGFFVIPIEQKRAEESPDGSP